MRRWAALLALLLGACASRASPPPKTRVGAPPPSHSAQQTEPEAAIDPGTPPPLPLPEPPSHLVVTGDTAYSIARRHGVTVEALLEANGITDARTLQIGQRLRLPGGAKAPESAARTEPAPPAVAADDDPPQLPEPPKADVAAMRASLKRAPQAGKKPLIWPVDGVVVSLFGQREGARHDGIDIGAPEGTAIWAAAGGKVVFAGEQPGYGRIVILSHDGELVTVYAHNAANLVKDGDVVEQGDPIAQVGTSGGQSTPVLHFEVRMQRDPVNPLSRLP